MTIIIKFFSKDQKAKSIVVQMVENPRDEMFRMMSV